MISQDDSQEMEDTVYRIREFIPDAVIRTQFIVGFSGEGEEFEELVEFVKSTNSIASVSVLSARGPGRRKVDGQLTMRSGRTVPSPDDRAE